jgi:hypothetical protein
MKPLETSAILVEKPRHDLLHVRGYRLAARRHLAITRQRQQLDLLDRQRIAVELGRLSEQVGRVRLPRRQRRIHRFELFGADRISRRFERRDARLELPSPVEPPREKTQGQQDEQNQDRIPPAKVSPAPLRVVKFQRDRFSARFRHILSFLWAAILPPSRSSCQTLLAWQACHRAGTGCAEDKIVVTPLVR